MAAPATPVAGVYGEKREWHGPNFKSLPLSEGLIRFGTQGRIQDFNGGGGGGGA